MRDESFLKPASFQKKGFVPLLAFGLIVLVALGVVFSAQFILKPGDVSGQELKKFSSCEQIQSFLEENSGSSGYYSSLMGTGAMRQVADAVGGAASNVVPMAAGGEKSTGGATDFSTTNIQVAGVDEPDIVKNDGKYIYTVSGNQIFIIDAYPAEEGRILSTINSTGLTQIFVNMDMLVVFGNDYSYLEEPVISKMGIAMPSYYPAYSEKTYIHTYDISDRENPALVKNISIEGNYFDARMIGDYVYLIVNKGMSYGGGPVPLPTITSEGVSKPACGCADLYYFDMPDYSYQFVTIASLNVKDYSAEPQTKVIMSGYTDSMYVSADNIYISYMKRISYWDQSERIINSIKSQLPSDISSQISNVQSSDATRDDKVQQIGEIIQDYYNSLSEDEKATFMNNVQDAVQNAYSEMAKETEKTVIQKIGIENGNIKYKGKGEAPGHLLNQFSLDENNGFLRVATTVDATWNSRTGKQASPSTNNVYVLDSGMAMTGLLEGLAPGESIYSARFIGDRAYLVTFKRVDPLFVIDLSDPSNPSLVGKLKIPGYSDYLHPYDENHLIGIGKDVNESIDADKVHTDDAVYYTAIRGVKLSLFDVTDVSAPKEIAKYVIGDRGTESPATSDHKAFLFSKDRNLLVIPITLAEIDPAKYPNGIPSDVQGDYTFQGAYVFNLDLNGFQYSGRITHADQETVDKSGYYWYSPYTIQRSLYIGENLYTISSGMVKANSLANLSELQVIKLPVENPIYPLYKGGVGMGGGVATDVTVTPPAE